MIEMLIEENEEIVQMKLLISKQWSIISIPLTHLALECVTQAEEVSILGLNK